jgi:hypothetical protein
MYNVILCSVRVTILALEIQKSIACMLLELHVADNNAFLAPETIKGTQVFV